MGWQTRGEPRQRVKRSAGDSRCATWMRRFRLMLESSRVVTVYTKTLTFALRIRTTGNTAAGCLSIVGPPTAPARQDWVRPITPVRRNGSHSPPARTPPGQHLGWVGRNDPAGRVGSMTCELLRGNFQRRLRTSVNQPSPNPLRW